MRGGKFMLQCCLVTRALSCIDGGVLAEWRLAPKFEIPWFHVPALHVVCVLLGLHDLSAKYLPLQIPAGRLGVVAPHPAAILNATFPIRATPAIRFTNSHTTSIPSIPSLLTVLSDTRSR